jgi:type II secretory pathway predicted ATPase ExeA
MYYKHFGLEGPPFRFSPSATPLFLSSAHRECLAALEWALMHDECGFMLLLGETGTGKSTLLNAILARRLPRVHLACVTNTKLSFAEIMRVILPQLGVTPAERGKLELIQQFEQTVSNRLQGHRTAIIVDEAQDLSEESLEDLRLLANRIGPQEQELQIVLIGHPELVDRLSAPSLRQLLERISTKVSLLPMSAEESVAYVECRLAAQGGSARKIFNTKALRRLVDAAHGIPRRLNVLCHNSLVLAYSKDAKVVSAQIAAEVVDDYRAILQASPATAARSATRKTPTPVPLSDGQILAPTRRASFPSRRMSIYAAGACATVAILGIGSLLVPAVQTRSDQIRHAVPAIAGFIASAHHEAAPTSYDANEAVASTSVDPAATGAVTNANSHAMPIAPQKPAAAPARAAIHIHPGDTFHDLATKYLGSKDRAWELIKANPQIHDPNVLYVGETIYLPSTPKDDQSRLVQ